MSYIRLIINTLRLDLLYRIRLYLVFSIIIKSI
jgi:hypothetical protein